MGLKVSVISTHHFQCSLEEINNMQPDGHGCVLIGPYLQSQTLSRIWPKVHSLLISTVWIYFEQHFQEVQWKGSFEVTDNGICVRFSTSIRPYCLFDSFINKYMKHFTITLDSTGILNETLWCLGSFLHP